jgi:D-xylose transport system permease protein
MTSSTMVDDPRLVRRNAFGAIKHRLLQGDIGQLPVIVGLGLIWAIFGSASNGIFFRPGNMVDLSNQMAATGTIAIGVVLILLLGEIDLTVAVVSAVCAAIMSVLNVHYGIWAPAAIVLGLAAGTAIGVLQGMWFAKIGIPSFVVTLAGLIGWQGVQLWILGQTGVVNLRNDTILQITFTYYQGVPAFLWGAAFVAYFALSGFWNHRTRARAGLATSSLRTLGIKVLLVAALVFFAIFWLTQERGLPLPLVILVGLIALVDYVLRRTRFGRMIFAVGGNTEAARRAGIPVTQVRIACFALCSTFAALGGIMAASRGLSVSQNSGGGVLLLYAIASAVIGGTSLFGGRGSAWAALLGVLVIQSIANGMTLISVNSDMQYIITAVVLLAAVTIDAVARRGKVAR